MIKYTPCNDEQSVTDISMLHAVPSYCITHFTFSLPNGNETFGKRELPDQCYTPHTRPYLPLHRWRRMSGRMGGGESLCVVVVVPHIALPSLEVSACGMCISEKPATAAMPCPLPFLPDSPTTTTSCLPAPCTPKCPCPSPANQTLP